MNWSHLRGAIGRSALLILLCWSGLAWQQNSEKQGGSTAPERIMVVHENGQNTRCRVVESWKLPDGRMAHLLQAIGSGSMITIVDDHAPNADQAALVAKNPRAAPKRIFLWGQERNPPEGSPIPPHLRHDSGVVVKNEAAPPTGSRFEKGPEVINRLVDEHALGKNFGVHWEGSQRVNLAAPANPGASVASASGQKNDLAAQQLAATNPQVVNLPPVPDGSPSNAEPPITLPSIPAITVIKPGPPASSRPSLPGSTPSVVNQAPALPSLPPLPGSTTDGSPNPLIGSLPTPQIDLAGPTIPTKDSLPIPSLPDVLPGLNPGENPKRIGNQNPFVGKNPAVPQQAVGNVAQTSPQINNPPGLPANLGQAGPIGNGQTVPPSGSNPQFPVEPNTSVTRPGIPKYDPSVAYNKDRTIILPTANPNLAAVPGDASKGTDAAAKKSWHFGDRIQAWIKGDPTQKPANPGDAKTNEKKNTQTMTNLMTVQNKVEEKKIEQNVEKIYRTPFSTAAGTLPPSQAPVLPRPEPSPLVIPSPNVPPLPGAKIIILAEDPKKQGELAPPAPESKRDMWGTATDKNILPPGRSMVDPLVRPVEVVKLPTAPPARKDDPLLAPERLMNPNDERLKGKVAALPELKNPVETKLPETAKTGEKKLAPLPPLPKAVLAPAAPLLPPPGEARVGPPPGAQSVLLARSGLPAQTVYVPYPIVTVPQPVNPPTPPEPKLDAPQLNAYLNAFSPPPAPKGMMPNGGGAMMTQPPMMPGNPMMNPMLAQQMYQQQMYQQQMYQQQMMQAQMNQQAMMQQQGMNPYGYRPGPGMMNPYVPPNGMMMNPMMAQAMPYGNPMPSQGPMSNVSRGYTGPQAPNPFMAAPMQPGVMPAGYMPMMPQGMGQQPNYPVSPQYAVATQVEQAMRVLRESPYPAQREWASQTLASFDWRTNPAIVPVLLERTTQDPAPNVRAGCIYTLGRIQAAVEPVFTTLQSLRNDPDPRIRQEAEQALIRMGGQPYLARTN